MLAGPFDWDALRLPSPSLRFLYARWVELVGGGAPVSFQAPVAGAPQLLREWAVASRTTEETGFGAHAVAAIEEEAFGVEHSVGQLRLRVEGTVEADPVVMEAHAGLVELHRQRRTVLSPGKVPDTTVARRLRSVVTVLSAELEAYVADAVGRLLAELEPTIGGALSPGAATSIDRTLTALASELMARGFAPSFLSKHVEVLGGAGSELVRLRRFAQRFRHLPEPARVAVVVESTREFWDCWPLAGGALYDAMAAVPKLEAAEVPGDLARAFTPHPGKRCVVYDLEAPDHHAAAYQAISAFQRTADLVLAEVPQTKVRIVGTVTRHGRGRGVRVSTASRRQLSLEPIPARSVDLARRGFAERVQAVDVDRSSLARLRGALRSYRISREATYDRTGLTNLWTALEALSPIERGVNVMPRVSALVAPLMGSYKASSLLNDVMWTMRQHGLIHSESLREDLPDLFDGEFRFDRLGVFRALATEGGGNLVAAASDDPLVGYHVRRFRAQAGTGKALVHASYRTARRVEWQVRRLYRLRNETVHGGATPQNARRVLRHLLLYVSRAVHVLSDLLVSPNGLDTIEEAASAIEVTYFDWAASTHRERELSALDDDALRRVLAPPFEQLVW